MIDPEDRIMERTAYDDLGRAISQEFEGIFVSLAYFDDGRRVITYGTGDNTLTETHIYNSHGLIVGEADGDAEVELYILDSDQNRISDQDRMGYSTEYDKTDLGYTTAITDAQDYTTTLEYDENNNWTNISRNGRNTSYDYDANNNLITRTNHFGDSVTYTYNEVGQETSVTNETGLMTEYLYDDIGQMVMITDALGLTQTFGYDDIGRVITTTDTTGKVTINSYDDADNVIQVIENYHPNGIPNYLNEYNFVMRYGFDGSGRQITMTDHVSRTSYVVYDSDGRQVATIGNYVNPNNIDPLTLCQDPDTMRNINICSQTVYDDLGRAIETIDPLGRVSRTVYDDLGRTISIIQNWSGDTNLIDNPASCLALPDLGRDTDICTLFAYDELGQSTIMTDSVGNMTRTFYDSLGRIEGMITNWQSGFPLEQCYDAGLSETRDENICMTFEYDGVGNTVVLTDSTGMATRTFYDELNRVTATVVNWNPATLQSPEQCVLSPDNIATENICSLSSYNKIGQAVTQTNALGQVSLIVYDSLNRPIIQVANWDGTPIASEVDCHFPPLKSDTNVCQVTRYDALGRMSSTVSPLGEEVTMSYDSLNRPNSTARTLNGEVITIENVYNAAGGQAYTENAEGYISTPIYDEFYRPIGSLSHEGTQVTQTIDILGRVISTTNNLGHTVVMTYDNLDRAIAQSDALGHVTRYEYDILNNQTVMIDAEGVRTRYEYDDLRRLVEVVENETSGTQTDESDISTFYSYDTRGNMIEVVNGRGFTHTRTIYDVLGRPIATLDARDMGASYSYNAIGSRLVMTDANGAATHYTYDGLNRPLTIFYEADNETIEYLYNALGQPLVMTDSVGTTTYQYDEWQRLTHVTDPFSQTLVYRYDLLGNRESLTYPDGRAVTYDYDGDNRLTTVTDWDSDVTSYDYDIIGRLITTTLPNGTMAVNRYDRGSRLLGLRYTAGDGSLLGEFSYELDDVGNRTMVTETLYAPDVVNEMHTFLEGNGMLVLEAEAGERTSGTTHDWVEASSQSGYSTSGYLQGLPEIGDSFGVDTLSSAGGQNLDLPVVLEAGTPTTDFPIEITTGGTYQVWVRGSATNASSDAIHVTMRGIGRYNNPLGASFLTGFGREWGWSSQTELGYPAELSMNPGQYTLTVSLKEDGVKIDQILLVTDTQYTPVVSGEAASTIQVISDPVAGGLQTTTVSYLYDGLYRLTDASYNGAITATYLYQYDSVGNMETFTETVNGEMTQVTRYFDEANRLISATDTQLGTTTYVYDDNGNMIQIIPPAGEAVLGYGFNQRNLMVTSDTAQFVYDGNNNRLKQIDLAESRTTTYTNDVLGLAQVLVASDGADTTYNLFGLDLLSQQENSSTEKRYPLGDGLGSVRLEIVGGTVEASRTYDPYGSLLVEIGERETVYGYTGEQKDENTGLLYLRARYYNPDQKVFMGRDPWSGSLQNPQSMNGWSYVEGNSINLVDPTGLFPDYCKDASGDWIYAQCVREHFGTVDARSPFWFEIDIWEYDIQGEPNCYYGAIPYSSTGYIEGSSGSVNAFVGGVRGLEVVYDFATMERQMFFYRGISGQDAVGGSYAESAGILWGFRSWAPNNIENNYSGWFLSTNIGLGIGIAYGAEIGPGIGVGGVGFISPTDRSIRGVGIYQSVGFSVDPLPGLDVAAALTYYWPIGKTVSYKHIGPSGGRTGVDKAQIVSDIIGGTDSPWLLWPDMLPYNKRAFQIRNYALKNIERQIDIFNEIHWYSY